MNDVNTFIASELAAAARDAGKLAWTVGNDTAANFCNGVISVGMASIAGNWIVSVFFCGADGKADLDRGEHDVKICATRGEADAFFRAYRAIAGSKGLRRLRRERLGL